MEWYNILLLIFGGVGGTSGVISWYNAKSNKQSIDISNLSAIIQEERHERQQLRKEYDEYKASVDERIRMFKKEFEQIKEDNHKYTLAIYEAYRCTFPKKVCDCPVIRAINKDSLGLDIDNEAKQFN